MSKKEGEIMEPYEAELYDVFQKLELQSTRFMSIKQFFDQRSGGGGTGHGRSQPEEPLNQRQKTEHFFMIILEDHRQMDAKHFKSLTGWGKNTICKGRRDVGFAEIDAWFGLSLWPSQR